MEAFIRNIIAVSGLILCFAAMCPVAGAQVYEWIDADGKRQFSDQPPPDNIEVKQKVYEVHNIDENMPAPIVVDADRERREARTTAIRSKAYGRACTKARERLKKVSGRVNYTDKAGNPVYVSERDRQNEVASLEADIKKHCH